MKALVLFSGGLDSTTALALAISKYGKENVVALSISYGQKHIKEIEASNKIARYYDVEHIFLDLAKIFEYSNCSLLSQNSDIAIPEGEYAKQLQEQNGALSTYVPFRNGLFLSSAASIALSKDCDIIYYGAHADDAAGEAYPDCSVEFTKAINEAIYLGSGKKVSVVGPFVNMHKADIVKLGLELNVPYELTWSCYEGHDKACGKCGTCLDRIKAFEANGVKDPIEYEEN
jgi:7-cyano-7-deazaguanine synthase